MKRKASREGEREMDGRERDKTKEKRFLSKPNDTPLSNEKFSSGTRLCKISCI